MSRREQVLRAVRFESPDYLPLLYFNGDRSDSDLIMTDVEQHFLGADRNRSEWGFTWHRADETMGQPSEPVIDHVDDLARYVPPDADAVGRFAAGAALMEEYGTDRYYIAALGLTGFTIMTFLWGFSRLLEDLHLRPEVVSALADVVFDTENRIIERIPKHGYDAVAFFDDWGTQSGMIVSPSTWREVFAPRYRAQFELCRALGLDVYFHSCGNYRPIVSDLFAAGVDLLNVSQPNVYDLGELATTFAGRRCFVFPVSYQTTSITGSCEEIRAAVSELVELFAAPEGGLIGYVEEYESIGMSEENYRCCIDAFRNIGRAPFTPAGPKR